KRRNEFETIVNAFTLLNKAKDVKSISLQQYSDSLKEIMSVFNDNYKAYYRVNDYSIASVSQSNNDGKKNEMIAFLNVCKNINAGAKQAQKTERKVTPKKVEKKAQTVKETSITNIIA